MAEARTVDVEEIDPRAAELAQEIRKRRKDADLSHAQLATRIGYSRQYVSLAERPRKGLPSAGLVRALDGVLGSDGVLIDLHRRAVAARRGRRVVASKPAAAEHAVTLSNPSGQFFTGAPIPAQAYPATDDGRILARIADDSFLQAPRRALAVGAVETSGEPRLFGMDVRHARRRLANNRLLIPRAYALDDLTVAAVWAAANLDQALLDDDAALAENRGQLHPFDGLPRSAVSREAAADLTAVSQLWLGSEFCARHILRHAQDLSDQPVFWSREQRGEVASTWLLFAHKYDYLRRTAPAPARAFCIPQAAVSESSRPERILIFLALALMESMGTRVDVCAEPEYAEVPGFVLDQGHRAILANWVDTEAMWHVDLTDARPHLRELADASAYADAHSAIAARDPARRLQRLADYLGLEWPWLVRRCAELGEYGAAGVAQTRSRLLSLDGFDHACRFVGSQ